MTALTWSPTSSGGLVGEPGRHDEQHLVDAGRRGERRHAVLDQRLAAQGEQLLGHRRAEPVAHAAAEHHRHHSHHRHTVTLLAVCGRGYPQRSWAGQYAGETACMARKGDAMAAEELAANQRAAGLLTDPVARDVARWAHLTPREACRHVRVLGGFRRDRGGVADRNLRPRRSDGVRGAARGFRRGPCRAPDGGASGSPGHGLGSGSLRGPHRTGGVRRDRGRRERQRGDHGRHRAHRARGRAAPRHVPGRARRVRNGGSVAARGRGGDRARAGAHGGPVPASRAGSREPRRGCSRRSS